MTLSPRMSFLALWALAAGLLFGPAARAQVTQQDAVSYALTLIDAGDPDAPNVTKNGGPVTAATTHVRVKVTVSVPRTAGSSLYGGITAAATPARLMFRRHKGPETAFDGSIGLTRDAPYTDAAGTTPFAGYYPMPQRAQIPNAAGTGTIPVSQTDPTQLNYCGVRSSATSLLNLAGVDYNTYLYDASTAADPDRWEATFLSPVYAVADIQANADGSLGMLQSLLAGSATYEWYAASRYGLGSYARISDIQDHGRKMTFTDARLWAPAASNTESFEGNVSVDWGRYVTDNDSLQTFGPTYVHTLRSMPDAERTWSIHGGAVGVSANGRAGLQLLSTFDAAGPTDGYQTSPRLESPVYPDGIAAVTFEAFGPSSDDGTDPMLLVQVYDPTATATYLWRDVATLRLTQDFVSYTVDFKDADGAALAPASSNARFRIVRASFPAGDGTANLRSIVIRNLLVRSAAPAAAFDPPTFVTANGAAAPYYNGANPDFAIRFAAKNASTVAGDQPRGYKATLAIRRRADGDTLRTWRERDLDVTLDATGGATLSADFHQSGYRLATNADGSTNAAEGAFFLKDGVVDALLPGVYDLALEYGVFGSFAAGREEIDGREVVTGRLEGYDVSLDPADPNADVVTHPFVADVRAHAAAQSSVFARVTYRSGTGIAGDSYTLRTVDYPLLPAAAGPNRWRIDLPRLPDVEGDDSATYVWGYTPEGDDADPVYQTGYLSVKLCAVSPDGTASWYGKTGTATALPEATEAVPATSDTLERADAETGIVPIVVPLAAVPNSHVTFDLDLTSAASPTLALCGTYWQDFNTWYAPSSVFTETEFREDVDAVTADFDCEVVGTETAGYAVGSGWIPDEGPLADTSSFTDIIPIGYGSTASDYVFAMPNLTGVAGDYFRQWGAGSESADPRYLREGELDNNTSEFVRFAQGTEVVLRREWTRENYNTVPNAQLRLRGQSDGITPREDAAASVVLNGIGAVSFTLGMSIPYDINQIAYIGTAENPLMGVACTGIAAGVQISNTANNAASGFSVSYYLVNNTTRYTYELRLTQILDFSTDSTGTGADAAEPANIVIGELYQWLGSTATRLPIATANERQTTYAVMGSSLAGNSYALWFDADGYLRAGTATGMTSTSSINSNSGFTSYNRILAGGVANANITPALGSAECRPTFRRIARTSSPATTFAGSAVSSSTATVTTTGAPTWAAGNSWTYGADPQDSGFLRVTRKSPPAQEAGRVRIWAESTTDASQAPVFDTTIGTDTTDTPVEVTVGLSNARLHIAPAGADHNIFIDNISVSSWCGTDTNRNGDERVPGFTDPGFSDHASLNGFAGVGIWIRPADDAQLDVAPRDYLGSQCVLLQRSRQNTASGLSGEIDTAGITTTGSSLALYSPFSDHHGFGTVTFRYRIPSTDESGYTNPAAYVMLQYVANSRYTNNFLDPPSGWQNVSDPVILPNTAGEWATTSITPRFDDGSELVGVRGTLRLVLVIPDEYVGTSVSDYDPLVYIDDFTVTDNKEGTIASWTADNVLLTDTPISWLFWKDRQPVDNVDPADPTFAEKSGLTRAFQFNDVRFGDDVDGTRDTSYLDSPPLDNGVGRITFAARLAEQQAAHPVRLYIYASEDENSENPVFNPVTYVEVTNTVYNIYDLDLSKFTKYSQAPGPDLLPADLTDGDGDFDARNVRRIRFRTLLEGDGVNSDGFSDNKAIVYGRVLMDRLAISDPVLPTLRIESVAFSNVTGANAPSEFDASSPLSQPVAGASILRTMVTLGRKQLIDDDTLRVFMTVDASQTNVSTYTSAYTYTDVLGNTRTASSTQPIFGWNTGAIDQWPVAAWFDLESATGQALAGSLPPNTVELTRATADNSVNFFGDLSALGVAGLPANSLVRYTVWAIYQSSEDEAGVDPADKQWFSTQIDASSYKEYPWYFPRSLNQELRAYKNNQIADPEQQVGEDFFCPYFWIYSCIPGEVFINEFDFNDASGIDSDAIVRHFVEICAPTNVDLANWRVGTTDAASTDIRGEYVIEAGDPSLTADGAVALTEPDAGVVPSRREAGTSANRSFYTFYSETARWTVRDAGGATSPAFGPFRNAGLAKTFDPRTLSTNNGASILLYRPTGGAEHIVVFSTANSVNIGADTYQNSRRALYQAYQNAYVTHGFGGEWYQDFAETPWENEMDAYADVNITDPLQHSRRLALADVFRTDANGRYTRAASSAEAQVNDSDGRDSLVNSIATVDMGGTWVTRTNAFSAAVENGPVDLTHLLTEGAGWPIAGVSAVVATRPAGAEVEGVNYATDDVQVTPRQVNPDQFILPYTGLTQCSVTSTLTGNGQHTLEQLDAPAGAVLETSRGGTETPKTWSVVNAQPYARLTYTPLVFHAISSVRIRLRNSKTGDYLDQDELEAQIGGATVLAFDPDTSFATLEVTDPTAFAITLTLYPVASGDPSATEDRLTAEAEATFVLDPDNTDARDVITSVSPYCGDTFPGSAKYQPWWGSAFGFQVTYDTDKLADLSTNEASVSLSSVLIVYPAPGATGTDWAGLDDLQGATYDAAIARLAELSASGARYVQMNAGAGGRFADSSLVGILSTAYAQAAGYDPATGDGAANKEPAIPFVAWGVYTVTMPTEDGSATASFLMRQALPGENAAVTPFTKPAWYAAIPDEPTFGTQALPYFYLYSTPPQSAWLSEVNPAAATGTNGNYAEIVFPHLREGITAAGVPDAEASGWALRAYGTDGAQTASYDLAAAGAPVDSRSSAYDYLMLPIAENAATQAYVLHRPCGAAEGGVWTGVDANGDTAVTPPATLSTNSWLLTAESYVVPGVTDSSATPGSVQLVGQQQINDGGLAYIPSDVTLRTVWAFAPETYADSNDDGNGPIHPDPTPEWNQVTVVSALVNEAYSSGACATQMAPGFFETSAVTGVSEDVTVSLSGTDWPYAANLTNVLSYRPKTNYCFASITIPSDLVGHVMLIGGFNGALTQAAVTAKWQELLATAEADPNARTTTWLSLDGRATPQTRSITAPDGSVSQVYTGVITFDITHDEGDGQVFADLDDYVVTLLFVDEPASAQNAITVAFTQSDLGNGAWLLTQTLFALDDAGAPDPERGGSVVTDPIWSDALGTASGDHANVHGWLHQPVIGDRLGMSAVIDPELGLIATGKDGMGDSLETLYANLANADTTLRPFLVWTLVPADQVPDTLFAPTGGVDNLRTNFMDRWRLASWLGSLPSVKDGLTASLSGLRRTLQSNLTSATGGSAFIADAGIIPMRLQGYADPSGALVAPAGTALPDDRGDALRLAFTTFTQAELEAALASGAYGLANTAADLLPYAAAIDTSDRAVWEPGSILRFAIILADTSTDRIYDCQGIANFSSDAFEGYCPWYVPDADANINAVTVAENRGFSPYAWIYSLGRNDVWLNEIRPFAQTDAATNAIPSALEIAMKASPLLDLDGTYKAPADLTRTDGRCLPRESLDGWKVVVKYAPLPLLTAAETDTITWVEAKTFDLVGWIPYRRIAPDYSGDDPNFYSLDYYTLATTVNSAGFANNPGYNFTNAPYLEGDPNTLDTFAWLPTPEEILDDATDAAIRENVAYANGVLYAVALVRDNGVVTDEVLFQHNGPNILRVAERVTRAVAMENNAHVVANPVRTLFYPEVDPTEGPANASVQFVDEALFDDTGAITGSRLTWTLDHGGDRSANTFPGPNQWSVFRQPYGEYAYVPVASAFSVTAQILGASGTLALDANGVTARGRSVQATLAPATPYTLAVDQLWDTDWFTLRSVTKNGAPITLAPTPATRYAIDGAALRATPQITLDDTLATADADYVLTLGYTPSAERLARNGDLDSQDEGFLDWLLRTDPDAILAQTAADGVTAAEKYWLGLDAADYDATDLSLRFTLIGSYTEDAAVAADPETLPVVSLALTDAGRPIESLRGDGAILLLGKENLDDHAWRFVQQLQPRDLNGERILTLRTDCRFFRAVLVSQKEAAAAQTAE